MTKQPRRPTTTKCSTATRRSTYATQWDADAAQQQRDLERYADRWNAQARAAGNPNA